MLFVVCCVLFAVCRLLFDVCYLLCVVIVVVVVLLQWRTGLRGGDGGSFRARPATAPGPRGRIPSKCIVMTTVCISVAQGSQQTYVTVLKARLQEHTRLASVC